MTDMVILFICKKDRGRERKKRETEREREKKIEIEREREREGETERERVRETDRENEACDHLRFQQHLFFNAARKSFNLDSKNCELRIF